jgi:hypothetical protein
MYNTPDRRGKLRIACDFPAIITGCDPAGRSYNENATLANLSASGLYMMMNRCFENGSKLSVTVLLTKGVVDDEISKLSTRGIVVRTETNADGTYGIAVKFTRYRVQ